MRHLKRNRKRRPETVIGSGAVTVTALHPVSSYVVIPAIRKVDLHHLPTSPTFVDLWHAVVPRDEPTGDGSDDILAT
jgi:hypothetical protein